MILPARRWTELSRGEEPGGERARSRPRANKMRRHKCRRNPVPALEIPHAVSADWSSIWCQLVLIGSPIGVELGVDGASLESTVCHTAPNPKPKCTELSDKPAILLAWLISHPHPAHTLLHPSPWTLESGEDIEPCCVGSTFAALLFFLSCNYPWFFCRAILRDALRSPDRKYLGTYICTYTW